MKSYHLGDLQISNKMNGRGLRQGNMNKEVEILRYVTKKSFDAYIWQTLETKQKFISQLFAGSKEIRTMSDIDNTTMNFGEIKAIATDNQAIMEKFEVDLKVQELKLKERNYKNQKYKYEDNLKVTLPKKVKKAKEDIEKYTKDIKIRDTETFKDFSIELNNKIFNDKKEAGNEIIKSINPNVEKDVLYEIGKYRGFKLYLSNEYYNVAMYLIGNKEYYARLTQIPSLNIQKLDEVLEKFEEYISENTKDIDNYEREIEQCKMELEKPFADAEKLRELLERQSELNNKLNLDNKKDPQTMMEDIENENTEEYEQEDEEFEEMEEYT